MGGGWRRRGHIWGFYVSIAWNCVGGGGILVGFQCLDESFSGGRVVADDGEAGGERPVVQVVVVGDGVAEVEDYRLGHFVW